MQGKDIIEIMVAVIKMRSYDNGEGNDSPPMPTTDS
jgi:hypothetical protein